jgi:membrane protein DedA with SNARE-associated domain
MFDFLYQLAPYAPIVICAAAFLDIFCLTGLFLYGGATLTSVAMLLATGMITVPTLIISATLGTLTGSIVNFYCGKVLSHTKPMQKLLHHPRVSILQSTIKSRGLTSTVLCGRFLAPTRPLYSLLLGTLDVKPSRFLVRETPIAVAWVTLWLGILLTV